jgi:hypothetical protein
MAQDPSSVEQAVSRAVRDNLAALQRVGEEVQQALADLTAACASSRPTNALPAMLRAQTAAASLAASIEVLARFVAGAMQPISRAAAVESAAVIPMPTVPAVGSTMAETAADAGREMGAEGGPSPVVEMPAVPRIPEPEPVAAPEPAPTEPAAAKAFDIKSLSTDEQELHRRANRVAKVSMQDIKMLRPDDVKTGREKKDLCARLRQDLDKARKEYERRFRSILDHPVDYFYDWAVDVLADGDASALGEYPYPQAGAARR